MNTNIFINVQQPSIKSLRKYFEMVVRNKFCYEETECTTCNSEGIVIRGKVREYIEQFLTARVFCRVKNSSSDSHILSTSKSFRHRLLFPGLMTLKMKALKSFETSVTTHSTTRNTLFVCNFCVITSNFVSFGSTRILNVCGTVTIMSTNWSLHAVERNLTTDWICSNTGRPCHGSGR